MARWFADLRNRSILARGSLLGLVVFGLFCLVAPVAWYLSGESGLATAALAAALCLAGAMAALAISSLLGHPQQMLLSLGLAMAARTGIPLGVGLACHMRGGALAETGLVYYLLVFYPVTLGIETVLSLPHGQCALAVREARDDDEHGVGRPTTCSDTTKARVLRGK